MENVKYEDYTLWLKLLKKIDLVKGINEPLAKYRIHKKGYSYNKF